MSPDLTAPRRSALLQLHTDERARISTSTGPGSISSAGANWLVRYGYAYRPSSTEVEITVDGRALAAELTAGAAS